MRKWWTDGNVSKLCEVCPKGFMPGRIILKRKSPTQETKDRISASLMGNTPWNKGISTGPESDETRKKKSDSAKSRIENGGIGPWFEKGRIPWNAGLTAETSETVRMRAEKQRGQIREGDYPRGVDHPNWNGKSTELALYRRQVQKISERTYTLHKSTINPKDYPRGKNGQIGVYQLDHIISIKEGFDKNISAEEMGSIDNLQMLTWQDNRDKWHK